MSLENPTLFEKALNHKQWFVYGGLALVLIGSALYLWQCGSNAWFNRGVRKDKEAIANKTAEIANKTAAIEQMKQERAEDIGELKVLTDNLQTANVNDMAAKEEVKQAAANLAAVVNSNANAVNARVEDVNKKLDQLGIK